jgi:putative transposase
VKRPVPLNTVVKKPQKKRSHDHLRNPLVRRYGGGTLHFITFSCYRRLPLLGSQRARDAFLKILNEIRDRYDFALIGYVLTPEHVHLLISEPRVANPSLVIQVLKQRVSRALRKRRRRKAIPGQMKLWDEPRASTLPRFWQRRFYDFNVWSERKKNEKLNYMHFNPVKRALVSSPKQWRWSSYGFYWHGEPGLCPPNPQ